MPKRVPTLSPRRAGAHVPEMSVRFADIRRGSASQRGYNNRWHKARTAYIVKHPLCVCCDANGTPVPAQLVDHIIPHRGDKVLFWDSGNWQQLCNWCHNNIKQSIEAAWLAGRLAADQLRLDRVVPGWRHPSDRM